MAYTHSKYEVMMHPALHPSTNQPTTQLNGFMFDVTGPIAHWGPGIVPHMIRGVAYVQRAPATNTDALSIRFSHNKPSGGTATNIATLNVPTTITTAHQACYYIVSGNVELKPGEWCAAQVTAAVSTGGLGTLHLYVEPRWEEAGNLTGMTKTTGLPSDA